MKLQIIFPFLWFYTHLSTTASLQFATSFFTGLKQLCPNLLYRVYFTFSDICCFLPLQLVVLKFPVGVLLSDSVIYLKSCGLHANLLPSSYYPRSVHLCAPYCSHLQGLCCHIMPAFLCMKLSCWSCKLCILHRITILSV